MNRFDLVIKNPDGSVYWSMGFDSKFDLNQWLNAEQQKFYWKKDFKVEITDNSAALKALEDKAKADREAAEKKVQDLRLALKTAIQSKPKTIADAVAILEKIVQLLGIDTTDTQQVK